MTELTKAIAKALKIPAKDVFAAYDLEYPECLRVVALRDRIWEGPVFKVLKKHKVQRVCANVVPKSRADELRHLTSDFEALWDASWGVLEATVRWE